MNTLLRLVRRETDQCIEIIDDINKAARGKNRTMTGDEAKYERRYYEKRIGLNRIRLYEAATLLLRRSK